MLPNSYYASVEWVTGEIFQLTFQVDQLVNISRTHSVDQAIDEVVTEGLRDSVRREYERWHKRESAYAS